MNKKIFLIFSIFFISFSNILAFESNISIDKKDLNLWDTVKLKLEIKWDNIWKIQLNEIVWLENFDILSRKQTQSFNSKIAVINWETKTLTNSISHLDFVLKPKSDWFFTIGPAFLTDENETKQTNTLTLNVNKNNSLNNTSFENFSSFENTEGIQLSKKINYDILSIILVLVILYLVWILFYKQNPRIFNKLKEKLNNNGFDSNDLNNVDFEESKEIIYPEINDKDFILKIEMILKQKINKKYYIKGIGNKTYTEIISEIDNNLVDKEVILKIVDNLNKIKYSNILVNKNEILDLVKKI